jgi:hypothetical protein
VAALQSFCLVACSPERKAVNPVIDVWMNESVEKMTGKRWPRARDGDPLGMTAVEQPAEIVVHLPGTTALRFRSKHTVLQQERGMVTLVSVLPLDKAVDFQTAITKAEEISRGHGVTDKRFHETILHWRDAPPERGPFAPKYTARTAMGSRVNLYVDIRPADDDGWLIALELQKNASARE